MNVFTVIAFTWALMASGIAILAFLRLNNLEKKLKELDVVPEDFSSLDPAKSRSSKG